MKRLFACVLAILAAVPLASNAGAQTAPPRDSRPPAATATAAVTGRVVDGVSGAPLARARVRLNSTVGPPALVVTDNAGTFRFAGLAPGGYSVTAEKSTYMPGVYPGGTRTLRSDVRPLMLAAGQTVGS